ncbi:uncharacterized protein LOC116195334 [Punica granatum]|nr:uncharacterized protein LOC116195334 [Punica granatum]
MASTLQKFLRQANLTRAISTLQGPARPHQFPALRILDSHIAQPGLLGQFLGRPTTESSAQTRPPAFFPSFPLGFCSGPIYVNLAAEPDADGVVSDESDGTMWADSVKKKRKKKMNKHKYKKLRKRLRRQT